MLDKKTNHELITDAIEAVEPTEVELELADRLMRAIDEIDRLALALATLRGIDSGPDT